MEFCSRAIPGPSQNSALSGPPPPKVQPTVPPSRFESRKPVSAKVRHSALLQPYAAQLRVGPAVGAACSHRHQGFHRHPVRTPCAGGTVFPGFAFIVHPSRQPCHGPFQPGAGRPSVHRTSCRSLSGSGSLTSPSPCTAKARQPLTFLDRLPAQRSTAFRALGHCQTLRRLPPPRQQEPQRRCPHPPCRLRDCQQPRPTGRLPLPPQC